MMKSSTIVATSRDVQEIVSKLSSDRAKTREEGVKLLAAWLEGERAFSFCKLLGRSTASLKSDEIPHAETWPFLLKLLMRCITMEISASKKRQPKFHFAKVLRTAIQRAEDVKFSGKGLMLLSVGKMLFNHILDVLKEGTIYHSEYSIILRHLLSVMEYRYQIKKRVYCSLVLFFMNNVGEAVDGNCQFIYNTKEEVFRNALTLHVLLENPPGDFPDNLREDAIRGFVRIFSKIREEGKVTRKLMGCINMFLLKDGPNLGNLAMDLHNSMQDFILHCWLTTHDRGLKNSLILYAKLQLKLNKISAGGSLIEQLLDIVDKELDQSSVSCTVVSKTDTIRDDKACTLGDSQVGLMELAASVYYKVCARKEAAFNEVKRLKREDPSNILKDGLMKGKWMWCGCFYFLMRNYGSRIDVAHLRNWFEGICQSFERILTYSSSVHFYDGIIWLLRGMDELLSVISRTNFDPSSDSSSFMVRSAWCSIWNSLMHVLPVFSNIPQLADAAMSFLGNMIAKEIIKLPIIPQEVWELPMFKKKPSSSALYLISCYFSRRGIQSEHGDIFILRKNLLKAALGLVSSKETFVLNESSCILLPAAICSLCSGSCPFSLVGALNYSDKVGRLYENCWLDVLDCSVEVLSEICPGNADKVVRENVFHMVRLPHEMKKALISDSEEILLQNITLLGEVEKLDLQELFSLCSFGSNCIYGLNSARLGQERSFSNRILQQISKLLGDAISYIEGKRNELQASGYFGIDSSFITSSIISSLTSLIRSPLFSHNDCDVIRGGHSLMKSLHELLVALISLSKEVSCYTSSSDAVNSAQSSHSQFQCNFSDSESKLRIVDMELDVKDGSSDGDAFSASEGSNISSSLLSSTKWKLDMVSAISQFFPVFPVITWDGLFNICQEESDVKVQENIICCLCRSFSGHTSNIFKLVNSCEKIVHKGFSHAQILTSVGHLLEKLISVSDGNDDDAKKMKEMITEQPFQLLVNLLDKLADLGLPDWYARAKLIDCICRLVVLDPYVGQVMISRLLHMFLDTDYRVRLTLARQIGVLFQQWDGHDAIFQDVCSSFGVELVMVAGEKVIKAHDVLAASRPGLVIETILIALAHVALYSENLEIEVIFMICAVASTDPSQRELIYALLDNLSGILQYFSRAKYLGELMAPILYRWVTCEVSLTSLVEIQGLFIDKVDTNLFLTFCCPWLLPSLIIHQDIPNLNLVSRIYGQPLSFLVRRHFVEIFSICMAICCSENPNKIIGEEVLGSLLAHFAEISEHERDNLIKRHMVSIVSHLLSLSSSSSKPIMPFFSRETIKLSLLTVVDGFLDIKEGGSGGCLVDKLNVFRPDRVFKFLLEMHYQMTKSVHRRHKCHHLSSVQVLVDVIGNRATVSSTSYYIFNLVGQLIDDYALQDQCCMILSTLLATFNSNLKNDVVIVLGRQLQFLVSKLVASYLTCTSNDERSVVRSSQILHILHQLTVEADPSLYDYIRELEPFPEIDPFMRIQKFLHQICHPYSPQDQLRKLVKRSHHLSQVSLSWSLRLLHKKLVLQNPADNGVELNSWMYEPEVVSAVWSLAQAFNIEKVKDIAELVADIIATDGCNLNTLLGIHHDHAKDIALLIKVGIGDPYLIVFHLPRDTIQKQRDHLSRAYISSESPVSPCIGILEEDLIHLMKLLKKYVMDDCVTRVDVASRALKGILSTERGHNALQHFDAYERSLVMVHSKGVDHNLIELLLKDFKERDDGSNGNKFSGWTTCGKSYKEWICPLAHFLISYSNDVILQLCHDIVLQTDEIAEFLFPLLLLNIAGRNDLGVDICQLFSEMVQENILVETNNLIISIQVLLHAFNRLRSFHVTEKASLPPIAVKHGRASGTSKSRRAVEKSKVHEWKKVYWLSVDYLLVAKAALRCGSFFTTVMYVEYWCEEHFKELNLGSPNFSSLEMLAPHIQILIGAITQINEPDSIYGIIKIHKLATQIVTYEHEEKWNKALEYYDLLARSSEIKCSGDSSENTSSYHSSREEKENDNWKSHKGLMRSLQQIGCMHVLNVYCQGLSGRKGYFQEDPEFAEIQYEAAWRAGNWDFSLIPIESNSSSSCQYFKNVHFNENLHSCLRAFREGDCNEFFSKIKDLKKDLMLSISNVSRESTKYIHSTIVKIQMLDHLSVAWDLRWTLYSRNGGLLGTKSVKTFEPHLPSMQQMRNLNSDWNRILKQCQLNLNLLEPFIAFRNVLLGILNCKECRIEHLMQSACILRKGGRSSLAVAALHEMKLLCGETEELESSDLCSLGRIEEARVLWAQGQHELAIHLAQYVLGNYQLKGEASNVYRLVGKWLAETHSSNSSTILEKYLKPSVEFTEPSKTADGKCSTRRCQAYFNLAHYSDSLFKSHEERLSSTEWQAAMRLRKHKARELDALIRRLKGSTKKGEKTDYSVKIQELQKQLLMDKEEAQKLQDDRDNFLKLALEGYQRCIFIGSKYDIRVVFRLVSLWFTLSSRQPVVTNMLSTVKETQSCKFIPLVYQIASRMSSSKDVNGSLNFQTVLISLLKKMAVDHPYHTIYQLLALANGDRVKDKQRNRNSFIVDLDKKQSAENLLNELLEYHGPILTQMKQMVEAYIKLAELETKKEETNKRMPLPREIRNLRQLELVPVVTASIPVDPCCEYKEGSFPHFRAFDDSIMVMNGINAPKVIECLGSDGHKYRQLAKSGNDDLRQDAVMEQFFGLVNTFLQNHRDTWKRKISIRTYKVVPFTPSAGVLEWVDGTIPLGEYLLGSSRNDGAHGRYGNGDWSFLQCREHMTSEKDKRKAFQKVCENFRPVMHYFFLERFLQPSDWFEKRLSYTRSVAASSMVGYIVGLGDRHSMNILIDQATAEVVHIDLGVAFEQGLMLKTPERVPFRLTRDMIDGMGVTGVEGVFRRCCEETLSVMRANKDALLIIIEVFIHDPLYKWALSPLKALQRQKETYDSDSNLEDSQDEYEGNKDAARALLRVKQKLDGYEEGDIRSVHGQVQQLIHDAIDTERLCHMFPGWGAWL